MRWRRSPLKERRSQGTRVGMWGPHHVSLAWQSIHLAPGDSTTKEFNCLACQPEIDSSLMFGKWDDLKPSSLPGTARAISGIGLYGEGRCQPLGWLPLLLQLCYWPHLWAETGTNANILPSQDPRTTFLVKVILFSRRVTCIHWLKCESETLEI